jgi:hypothetical protein
VQSAFERVTESLPYPPRKVITIRDEDWASTFQDKPVVPIKVGIRLLSLEDQETIRTVARQAAAEVTTGTSDAESSVHTAMLVAAVSCAICSPNDSRRGHEFFDCPNDKLPIALREETLKRLFDEVERLAIETSPIFSEATDDDVDEVAELLLSGALESLDESDPAKAKRVRRYIEFVREELSNG